MLKLKQSILLITLAALLIVSALAQTHLKYKPQIAMLVIGMITTATYFLPTKNFKRICFAMLLALTAYVFLFFSFIKISDSFYDIRSPLADIPSVIFAIIGTPVFIFIYYQYINPKGIYEKEFSSIFSVVTLTIFIFYEHLY